MRAVHGVQWTELRGRRTARTRGQRTGGAWRTAGRASRAVYGGRAHVDGMQRAELRRRRTARTRGRRTVGGALRAAYGTHMCRQCMAYCRRSFTEGVQRTHVDGVPRVELHGRVSALMRGHRAVRRQSEARTHRRSLTLPRPHNHQCPPGWPATVVRKLSALCTPTDPCGFSIRAQLRPFRASLCGLCATRAQFCRCRAADKAAVLGSPEAFGRLLSAPSKEWAACVEGNHIWIKTH